MILDLAVTTIVNGDLLLTQLGAVSTRDRRLSDDRTPLPHEHPISDIVGLGAALLALAAGLAAVTNDGTMLDRLLTDGAAVWVGPSGDVLWR